MGNFQKVEHSQQAQKWSVGQHDTSTRENGQQRQPVVPGLLHMPDGHEYDLQAERGPP